MFRPAIFRSMPLFALVWMTLFAKLPLRGQTPGEQGRSTALPRITEVIDDARLTRLAGNVPPLFGPELDQGQAEESAQLTHLRLVLQRSPEQEVALQTYLAELHDKSSPNYQKWLTPEQFGTLYGPSDSDMAALVAWLESHGLAIEEVSKGRTNIAFSATVSQVEEAFHTAIHTFVAGDQTFTSNIAAPSIPSALVPVVRGIAHMNTIRPRPLSRRADFGLFDYDAKKFQAVPDLLAPNPRPQLTTYAGGANRLFITAGDAATIYNSPNDFNGNFSGSSRYDGSRVSIGIGGDAAITTSTAGNYGMFTGGGFSPSVVNVDGVTSRLDSDEAYLDIELAHALAPGAAITYYTSTDLSSAVERAINDNRVDIFSLSFGECELWMTNAGNAYINSLWQQAAAQGIAVTVATGDSGSAVCDIPTDSDRKNVAAARFGMQVSGFASTPYNIAVGGTDFYALPGAFTTYVSGVNGVGYRSALKYIPESSWNDSTSANGDFANNTLILQAWKTSSRVVVVSARAQ
jgi:trimeric autotransporter adhesin